MIMKYIGRIVVWLVALALTSCSSALPQVEYNGRPLTEEELADMQEELERAEKAKETEGEVVTEAVTETEEPADGIVHWTKGGTVWHERESCVRISKKDTIQTGSIEQAMAAGKARGCATCCP